MRKFCLTAIAIMVFSISAFPANAAPENIQLKLDNARKALTGSEKDMALAKSLLLDILKVGLETVPGQDLCSIYVYLGYIEDRNENRDQAISWYRKAVQIDGPFGIKECAKRGLDKPCTWIRHLDEVVSVSPNTWKEVAGTRAYVSGDPPNNPDVPSWKLSNEDFFENFEDLVKIINENYAHFGFKSIDWPRICSKYRVWLQGVGTTEEFYLFINRLVAELKDSHSAICNLDPAPPQSKPQLALDLFGKKAIVTSVGRDSDADQAGIKIGAEIISIEGMMIPAKMESLRLSMGGFSTDQAFRKSACKSLLKGPKGSAVKVSFCNSGEAKKTVSLERTVQDFPSPEISFPTGLQKLKFVCYGFHPSGLGYIRISSFVGRDEIADEFAIALETLKNVPGLILDIRDNTGGYGTSQPGIIGRFLKKRSLASIQYSRVSPNNSPLKRSESFLEPKGPWTFQKPIALLFNENTGSAADLFATRMKSVEGLKTFGMPTHGNLSGTALFAKLPCNLIIRISNGYICDPSGKIIEGKGNVPDFLVAPTVSDLMRGRDPVLEKAAEVLSGKPARPADSTGKPTDSPRHN